MSLPSHLLSLNKLPPLFKCERETINITLLRKLRLSVFTYIALKLPLSVYSAVELIEIKHPQLPSLDDDLKKTSQNQCLTKTEMIFLKTKDLSKVLY